MDAAKRRNPPGAPAGSGGDSARRKGGLVRAPRDYAAGVPASTAATEAAFLGAAILRGDAGEALDRDTLALPEAAFTEPRLRLTWRALRQAAEAGEPVDRARLTDALAALAPKDAEGRPAFAVRAHVEELADACPSSAFLDRYASELRKAAGRRELARVARAVAEWAENGDRPTADLVAELRRAADAAEAEGGDALAEAVAAATLPFPELLTLTLPEPERWLPWLGPGTLAMVYARPGIGKTLFCAGLAGALVTGAPFMRWETARPVGVLYVDGEMELNLFRERLAAMVPRPPEAPLEVLSHALVYERARRDLLLTDARFRDAILRLLDERSEVRLVIVDNFSALFRGIREDKKDDLDEAVTPFLLALRRRGVAALLVHHAGKGGDQRGTSGREDLLDAVIRLERPGDYDAPEGARFVVRFTKARSVTGDAVAPFEAALREGPDGRLTWTIRELDESALARVLRLVDDGVTGVREIAAELGVAPSTVSRALKKARTDNLVTGNGPNLELTPEGRHVAGR